MPQRNKSFPLAMVVMHGGFAFTGLVETLLGPILLVLAPHLALKDAQAGLLFTAQFAGSSLGAFLSRGNLRITMTVGYVLLGISSALLAGAGLRTVFILFFVFGLGMGMAMTSTSMFIGLRFAQRRGAALSLLNFFWSLGAFACPLLVAPILLRGGLHTVFSMVAVAALLISAASLLAIPSSRETAQANDKSTAMVSKRASLGTIMFFAVLAFLYVGVETTVSGWMATYAHRIVSLDLVRAAAIPSVFWIAFVIGRGASTALLLRVSDKAVFTVALIAAMAGMIVILSANTVGVLIVGEVVIGLMLAPLFPLNLSLFFNHAENASDAAWVLGLCSFGGSVLPWASGVASAKYGSLRVGLLIPAFALAAMIGMSAVARKGPTVAG